MIEKRLYEELRNFIEELRSQEVILKLQKSLNEDEALNQYRKIKHNNKTITKNFKKSFLQVSGVKYITKNKVYGVIPVTYIEPADAILICIICHMTGISDDELLDYKVLKKALSWKKFIKRPERKVAQKIREQMYHKNKFFDEISDEEFVELFI